MKHIKLLVFVLIIFSYNLSAQVLINEIQAVDTNTITDEDGKCQDWIELYNAGPTAVNLNNYGLSDDYSDPFKWTFPYVLIQPNDHLLLFASGKDRKIIIDHWETAVFSDDYWRYFPGISEPPATWKETNFDDSSWPLGKGGFGYGDNDDSTMIAVGTISVYIRKVFNIADSSKISTAIFSLDYDDGFVAYLNGVEIARRYVNGSPPAYNSLATTTHEAHMYTGGNPENFTIDQALLKNLLVSGNNTLAIQVHNVDSASTDMSAIPFLSFGITDNSVFFSPPPLWFTDSGSIVLHTNFQLEVSGENVVLTTPVGITADQKFSGYIAISNSLARIPDGSSSWCITNSPTPGQSNNGSTCYTGYAPKPVFTLAPGFYSGTQNVGITASIAGTEIHYTKNGNIPNISDPLYTTPIAVDATTVLRAKCFGPSGFLPGNTATNTYLINENTALTTISLSSDSTNLWGTTGIYTNYSQDWKKDCHVECFAPMGNQHFELDATMRIHGGYSSSFDQKSFRITTNNQMDSSFINYQLFPDKELTSYSSFLLRNSGNDWFYTYFRDALMQRLVRNTNLDFSAYRPCITFINGKYWGIYNIREKPDKNFVEDNRGIDDDSIDIVRNNYNTPVLAEEGTMDAYTNMYNFIVNNDISIPANYGVVKSMLDIKNYADYFIAETYYINDDWIGYCINNIKLWRERKPTAKWRYLLWDLDISLGFNWSWIRCNYQRDKLWDAVNTTLTNDHSAMLKKILENSEFKSYFINRYADLINTIYRPDNMNTMIYGMRDSIAAEMPRALSRWVGSGYGVTSMAEWHGQIDTVVEFANNRPFYARNYIQDLFTLNGQVDVTLDAYPAGAGKIKISTIYPESLPWTGVYFDSNPVKITAIPNPGFTFLNWQANISLPSGDTNRSITLNIANDDTFVAVFSGNAQPLNLTFSEINYHSDSIKNAGDWIELHNYGASSVDISDWYFRDDNFYHKFVFPMGTVIQQHEYMVLSCDSAKFTSRFPAIHPFGFLDFNFRNSGERLTLFDNYNNPVVQVAYGDSVPWPGCADGYGRTLELKTDASDPGDPQSWFCGCVEGSPGAPFTACDNPSTPDEPFFNIYPNPAHGDLLVNYELSSDAYLTLYDILGAKRKIVKLSSGTKTERIYLNELSNGFYLFSVYDINDKKIKTGKIIVMN
ncbi:MAG TPA: CotH kinase family protein [Bacteroidales bacterium]|nr:CotH kinase family protein [Bacteroidales bacterium]